MVTWKRVYPPPTEFFWGRPQAETFWARAEARSDKTARSRLDRPQKPGTKNLWHSQVFRSVESQGAHKKRLLVLVFLPLIVLSNH